MVTKSREQRLKKGVNNPDRRFLFELREKKEKRIILNFFTRCRIYFSAATLTFVESFVERIKISENTADGGSIGTIFFDGNFA